ncbi:MAG: archaemetzincin family Zn-dependent metalloprotease [Promethearchaeota archaeon]
MKRTIGLLRIGDIKESVLIKLRKNLEKSFKGFNLLINIIQEALQLERADYNLNRRQYDASKVLAKIIYFNQEKQFFRILGVIDEDIYSEPLNFVFGLAINPKIKISKMPVAALISITRLRESFYRRVENASLFELRVLKEAIHEIGHTFKLEHCSKFCIMRFSNSLADTNKKPPKFCDLCQMKLNDFFKNL